MSDIAEQLNKQTNVSSKNQLVTFDKQLLENYLQQNGHLPATCVQRAAYLFNVEAKEVRRSIVSFLKIYALRDMHNMYGYFPWQVKYYLLWKVIV